MVMSQRSAGLFTRCTRANAFPVTDTETDTKTTFQRNNLVTESIGNFSHHKRAPNTKFSARY